MVLCDMTPQSKALLFASVAIAFWSTVASAFKISLQYLEPLRLLLFASVFSAVALFLAIFFQKKQTLILAATRQQIFSSFFLGVINPGLYYYVLLEAYRRLPAQEALAINYSWPILLTVLGAVVYKQMLTRLDFVAITIAYFGVLVVATHGNFSQLVLSDTVGVSMAAGSTLLFSTYWLINLNQKSDVLISLFWSFLLSIPVILIANLIFTSTNYLPGLKGIAGAVYIGCFEMGWTYLLWLSALKLAEKTIQISILAFFSPIISLLLINLVLHEPIVFSTWIGLLCIILGIALRSIYSRKIANV